MLCGKANAKPNPLTPFPTREGGKVKAFLLVGKQARSRGFPDSVKSQKPLLPCLRCTHKSDNLVPQRFDPP